MFTFKDLAEISQKQWRDSNNGKQDCMLCHLSAKESGMRKYKYVFQIQVFIYNHWVTNSFFRIGEHSDSRPLSLINPICSALLPFIFLIHTFTVSVQRCPFKNRQTANPADLSENETYKLHPTWSTQIVSDAATEHSGMSSNFRNNPLAKITTVSEGKGSSRKKKRNVHAKKAMTVSVSQWVLNESCDWNWSVGGLMGQLNCPQTILNLIPSSRPWCRVVYVNSKQERGVIPCVREAEMLFSPDSVIVSAPRYCWQIKIIKTPIKSR